MCTLTTIIYTLLILSYQEYIQLIYTLFIGDILILGIKSWRHKFLCSLLQYASQVWRLKSRILRLRFKSFHSFEHRNNKQTCLSERMYFIESIVKTSCVNFDKSAVAIGKNKPRLGVGLFDVDLGTFCMPNI